MKRHSRKSGAESAANNIPLCVDLDGTLIRTDILWESAIQLWRKPILAARSLIALLTHGKAAFKASIAQGIEIDPAALPYREDVLDYIKDQPRIGRPLVLATATHRVVAESIAEHLGVFARVFATEGSLNLSGNHKQAALESAYGKSGFDYIRSAR